MLYQIHFMSAFFACSDINVNIIMYHVSHILLLLQMERKILLKTYSQQKNELNTKQNT